MRVSTQFPIAVHILLMVAYFKDIRITSDMVAASAGCNPVIVRNIFPKLKRAGLLSVRTGMGGTSLARPAKEISLWDIYTAVESDETEEMFKIHPNTSARCPVGSNIRGLLLSHLEEGIAALRKSLSKVSLADMKKELSLQPVPPGLIKKLK
ncbi:Rrf2 family transcriptional regulator [Breznakiella homolactica]|uniref:Rrf2 family transcriptional regulator n=1 Tax=Breznakiella homolactica TaxID=2798577 RepID=A0A7T7XLX0_9SPIR|nr:Rrf2 family transcriptional regulator [Breznakiella homolactica]QQO08791.1 Rrf2 family transcriptional regulator [Breznakiella homolactica]